MCIRICINTGEPTPEEQAQLLIAALDLGSLPVPGSITDRGPQPIIPPTFTTVSRNISRISRRSISTICKTPSTEICTPSEWQYIRTNIECTANWL